MSTKQSGCGRRRLTVTVALVGLIAGLAGPDTPGPMPLRVAASPRGAAPPLTHTYSFPTRPGVRLLNYVGFGLAGGIISNFGFTPVVGDGSGGLLVGASDPFPFTPTSVAAGTFTGKGQTDDIVIADAHALMVYPVTIGSGGLPTLGSPAELTVGAVELLTLFTEIKRQPGQASALAVVVKDTVAGSFALRTFVVHDGTFQPTSDIDLSGQEDVVVAEGTSGDFNGDGLTDIALLGPDTGTTGFGQLIVLLNDGTGTFSDIRQFRQFVATDGATNIESGDFNNDGFDDLVFIDVLSNFAGVALNDGEDFFLQPTFIETGGFVPVSAAVADVNDDDNLDVVVANQGSGDVAVLAGDGQGDLALVAQANQESDFGVPLAEGKIDKAVVDGENGLVCVLLNAPAGTPAVARVEVLSTTKPEPPLRPVINAVNISGKKLEASGTGFTAGAKILVDGVPQKTKPDRRSPTTHLLSKKALKRIAPGQTVHIQVIDGDGVVSENVFFTRP